ncbi:hypothetical protein HSBAA_21550 [Vreelandella sulfidaeris]|uniref:Thioredoxin domain-containing protein n=1 Tax=Vreelandella sulfidaeris TaxID=115553 RepID=A0A455U7P0_9GAMM|nr:hypothetical protein HSBAA_21550 [Halomonas sulfidaeris]
MAGGFVWSLAAGSMLLMEQQSRPLPKAPLITLDGDPINLPQISQTSQQPLVVNLWASWCPPCIREMPVFEEVQRNEAEITFVFINQGESPTHIDAFMNKHDFTLDNVWLDPRNAIGQATGAHAMPTTLFMMPMGNWSIRTLASFPALPCNVAWNVCADPHPYRSTSAV